MPSFQRLAEVLGGLGRDHCHGGFEGVNRLRRPNPVAHHLQGSAREARSASVAHANGSISCGFATRPRLPTFISLDEARIPLPPLAEQHRIVAKVDELMVLCDQPEQQLSQPEQSRRGLLEAVLREALLEPQANWALQGRA